MISDAGTIMSDANPGVPHEAHMRARLETADLVTTAHGDQIKCINIYQAITVDRRSAKLSSAVGKAPILS
jgi:hypothetical protein